MNQFVIPAIGENQLLRDYFAGCVRDLTPSTLRHGAHVVFVPVSNDLEVTRLCSSILSDAEYERAECIAGPSERSMFTQRRAFRRLCGAQVSGSTRSLSQIEFSETENGRPYLAELPNVWFSFSSCRLGFIGAWSSTLGIGVDIEELKGGLNIDELARTYFTAAEANALEGLSGRAKLQKFFRFWCLKEAALKSIGEGLPFGLDTFEFQLDPNPHLLHAPPENGDLKSYGVHEIGEVDHCVALVTRVKT